MDPIEKFHAHLDLCEQCREHPFDLCVAGAQLLIATAGPSKPFSMSATTGRISSKEPRMQNIPVRTELGKQMRDAFLTEFPGPIRFLDTPGLEERLHKNLHEHAKKENCPLCAAGVPFEEEK